MKHSHKQQPPLEAHKRTPQTAKQRWEWESLQYLSTKLEQGECLHLPQEKGPVIGVIFQDTEADEERWEARLLANGTCYTNTHFQSATQAKRWVETRITRFLRQWKNVSAPLTTYEQRSGMENILVFLLASIEADEQILTVTEYHNLWVAICYNAETGFIQDYIMQVEEGYPYYPVANDFSGQYNATFRPRRKGNRRSYTPENNQQESGGEDTL